MLYINYAINYLRIFFICMCFLSKLHFQQQFNFVLHFVCQICMDDFSCKFTAT